MMIKAKFMSSLKNQDITEKVLQSVAAVKEVVNG